MLDRIAQQSSLPVVYAGRWPGLRKRLLGAKRLMRTLGKAVFIILFFAGWYGTWATYSNGYDQGRKDALADKATAEYARGVKDGINRGRRELTQENLSSVDAQVKAKVQEYEDSINQQMNAKLQQAFQAGASAYARQIIDHDLQFSSGPKKKENSIEVKK